MSWNLNLLMSYDESKNKQLQFQLSIKIKYLLLGAKSQLDYSGDLNTKQV